MKTVTPEEHALWEQYNQGTRRLRHTSIAMPSQKISKAVAETQRVQRNWERARFEFLSPNQHFGVDRILARKAKKIVIERNLDLHGFTREHAQEALFRFLVLSQSQGIRWVRVVTGKSGVLAQEVPQWLETFSSLMSGYTHAPVNDGGRGALYIRIRWSGFR